MSRFVNPSYNGSGGNVSEWTKVRVEDIDEDNHLALCSSPTGSMKITLLYLPGRGDPPQIGDRWFVERKFGQWVFSYYIVDLST